MDASVTSSTEFAALRAAAQPDSVPTHRRTVVAIDRFDHWAGLPVGLVMPSWRDLGDQAA